MLPDLPKLVDGYKTYIAAFGLMGLALYQFSQNDLQGATQSFLAGLAALGLRHAFDKGSVPTSAAIVALTVFLCSGNSIHAQEVAKPVLDKIRAASVTIELEGKPAGSGTLFEKEGETWCLTAHHVVNGCSEKNLRVTQRHSGKLLSLYTHVFRHDEKNDLALLKVGSGVFHSEVKFAKGKAKLDTAVVHCGSMNGFHHTITRGYLVSYDQEFQPKALRDVCDFTGYYGSSGGGVFNTKGEYIGMVVGGIEARIVFIVPLRAMQDILK